MATFPKLKTGAVMQYPATVEVQFRNQVLRFVDGSEQRYRDGALALHQWTVRLDRLDESELAEVALFFDAMQGAFETFAFVDPRNATEYPKCSLADDSLEITMNGELRGATALTVREERA